MLDWMHVLAEVPPINPSEPPGMEGLKTIMNWVAWIVTIVCAAGFFVGVAMLAIAQRNGETEGVKKIVVALIALALVGASGAIFAVIT